MPRFGGVFYGADSMNKNIQWHSGVIHREDRQVQNGHKSFILWFTGLSGAGKSTLAHRVEEILFSRHCRSYVIDGDNVRHGLCADLGFSDEDRCENIRRIGEMSQLFVDAGMIVLAAFISPFRADRDKIRARLAAGDFIEVYCDASLDVCESRDTKGLYKRARCGEIPTFTGISSPYEAPENPELTVATGTASLESCAWQIIEYLQKHDKIAFKP